MDYKCALIVVEDIERAKTFYRDLLGCRIARDFGENVSFEGGFAIHEKAHFGKLIEPLRVASGSNAFELYFEDVEGIQARLKGKGVAFVHELKEQPWRQRVLRFLDPDGNLVEIGESLGQVAFRLHLEDWTKGEISRITYLDEAEVGEAIRERSRK